MAKRRWSAVISLPIYWVLGLWIVHMLKLSTDLPWGNLGLMPRNTDQLIGILTSPWIHGSLQHLISNSVPLFVLSTMIMLFYPRVAYRSMFLIYLLTGMMVWLFARGGVIHIGASGVVYGLVSFVFWTGVFRRNIRSIILAMVVTLLYSGYFLGILPNQNGISWESHLLGGVVGIIVAFWMRIYVEEDEIQDDEPSEPETQEYFLPRDTFLD